MTKIEEIALKGWRLWSYADWNSKLADYYFTVHEGESSASVEQLPATPHELALVTGDPDASAEEIVDRFVSVMKRQLPLGEISFSGFCLQRRRWTTESEQPPHFFAMLWLTCLVAYGYPHGHSGSFHDRMFDIFKRQQHLDCLPGVWETMQQWTVSRAEDERGEKRFRKLVLPPRDSFRSVIGASWFLAFPHDLDRSRLRTLLERHDLVGEEPPLRRVVTLLIDAKQTFSGAFGQDLDAFVQRFVTTDKDVRNSAFWRAVRQEALRDGESSRARDLEAALFASYNEDDELLVPYVACTESATLPVAFAKAALGFSHNGLSCLVRQAEDLASDPTARAVEAALRGELAVPRAARHYQRGVMVFRAVASGEFELVSGTDAENADMALVRDELAPSFTGHFGGRSDPAYLDGWRQITDCTVRIGRDVPVGLESAYHLQTTMASPAVRIVGGIRGDNGYVALDGFLPRVRFYGATNVDIHDADGERVGSARVATDASDEWILPDALLSREPGRFVALVRWPSADGTENTTACDFTLGSRQLTHDYKGLGAGVYALEALDSGTAEVRQGEEVPAWIAGAPVLGAAEASSQPDMIETLSDVVYLAARLGDLSRVRTPDHEWLAFGDARRPSQLLFVGDPESPMLREPRKSSRARDRSVWRNAVHNSREVGVRIADGRIEPLGMHPNVAVVLSSFKNRRIDDIDESDESLGGLGEAAIPWAGVEGSLRAWNLADTFAALSVRRSGIRLNMAIELFGQATGLNRFEHGDTLYELLRSWVEAGLLDVVHARSQPVTYVVARRPGFVVYRVGGKFRASLIGLLPAFSARKLEARAKRRGALVTLRHGASSWQPSIVQVDVEELGVLRELSAEFELAPIRWFTVDLGGGAQGAETQAGARADPAYVRERVWDWRSSRFRTPPSDMKFGGITVELRRHPRCCPIYVICENAQEIFWSELRNSTLIQAYLLKYGDLPFTDEPDEPVMRTWARGIYLPVRFGRLCALLGAGLAGPSVDTAGKVVSYAYPLFGQYRTTLSTYLNPSLSH